MKSSKLKGISLQEKVFIVWNVMIIDLFHNHVLCNKRYLNYKYIYSFLVISNNDTLYSYYFSSIKHRSINYFCKSFIRPHVIFEQRKLILYFLNWVTRTRAHYKDDHENGMEHKKATDGIYICYITRRRTKHVHLNTHKVVYHNYRIWFNT